MHESYIYFNYILWIITARILTKEEGAPDNRGSGEDQSPRPDQTDISISGEDVNAPIVSIYRLLFDYFHVIAYFIY